MVCRCSCSLFAGRLDRLLGCMALEVSSYLSFGRRGTIEVALSSQQHGAVHHDPLPGVQSSKNWNHVFYTLSYRDLGLSKLAGALFDKDKTMSISLDDGSGRNDRQLLGRFNMVNAAEHFW